MILYRMMRAAFSLLLVLLGSGCFSVVWTSESDQTSTPVRAHSATTAIETPSAARPLVKFDIQYRESTNASIAAVAGEQTIRRNLERGALPHMIRLVPDDAHFDVQGTIEVQCTETSEIDGTSFLALLTFGALPGSDIHRVQCDADLRDILGGSVWHARFERTFRTLYANLPYVYLVPRAEIGGLFGYEDVRDASNDAVVEFAQSVGDLLLRQQPEIVSKLEEATSEVRRRTAKEEIERNLAAEKAAYDSAIASAGSSRLRDFVRRFPESPRVGEAETEAKAREAQEELFRAEQARQQDIADRAREKAEESNLEELTARVGLPCMKYKLGLGGKDLPRPKLATCEGARMIVDGSRWRCASREECRQPGASTICRDLVRNLTIDSRTCPADPKQSGGVVSDRGIFFYTDNAGGHP